MCCYLRRQLSSIVRTGNSTKCCKKLKQSALVERNLVLFLVLLIRKTFCRDVYHMYPAIIASIAYPLSYRNHGYWCSFLCQFFSVPVSSLKICSSAPNQPTPPSVTPMTYTISISMLALCFRWILFAFAMLFCSFDVQSLQQVPFYCVNKIGLKAADLRLFKAAR